MQESVNTSHRETSVMKAQSRRSPDDCSFEVRWTDLSYSYSSEGGLLSKKKEEEKTALHPCSGRAKSATVTAILGPSGAGKSTLLNCITGRNSDAATGKCSIRAPVHLVPHLRKSRIACVPQNHDFLTFFSVKETLLFASRMNNADFSKEDHTSSISSLLQSLDMGDKLHWPLRKLSGGQMKRVAIACALITRPAAVVLDEPTSGLDADNADRLLQYLGSIITDDSLTIKPAVILTIHSPRAEMFLSFDQVYMLSVGACGGR